MNIRIRGIREQGTVNRERTRRVPVLCALPPVPASSGFTFIEAIVSVAIFLVLIGTVAGIFSTFSRQQKQGITQATLLGEAQAAIEILEREVRTGFSNTFSGAGAAFSFRNQNNVLVTYELADGRLMRRAVPPDQATPVTPATVEIRSLEFVTRTPTIDLGAAPQVPILTGEQGRVTVRMRMCPTGIDTDQRCLQVQTTLTSRQYAPAL
ncbi:MAG: hypothetical protein G01um1014106_65 [Parcubacteria group bacterium Gr01-1014_106]|nr:MAG: hypothetical protein G01um1014106_65 [Parcubacteria group bacterium Gr01-1014_106]